MGPSHWMGSLEQWFSQPRGQKVTRVVHEGAFPVGCPWPRPGTVSPVPSSHLESAACQKRDEIHSRCRWVQSMDVDSMMAIDSLGKWLLVSVIILPFYELKVETVSFP